jgi:Second Messenger Oligonucleotide or Dinucleotide Synthetase domain
MSIKGRFERFTRQIRPTEEHFKEANRQTKHMVDELHDKVSKDGSFTLEKILRAGSNAKHTSLRKTDENRFDVDLGAYYSGSGATKERLGTLLEFTRDRLVEIYHQKDEEDFEILDSAVRVQFVSGIKLWVDVAPIIKDNTLKIENAGWIPRKDKWRLTSVTAHNDFVSKRNVESKRVSGPVHFNRLVRMMKWWNNLQGDLVQPSIFCELITAKAFAETGVTGEWQSSLRQIFNFLRKHQLLEPIVFNDYYDSKRITLPDDEVIVLDSVNSSNNVTREWTAAKRGQFLDRVQDAYDAMMDARVAENAGDEDSAVEHWCRVFGEAFQELSEDEED